MFAYLLALLCLINADSPPARTSAPPVDVTIYTIVDPRQPDAPLDHMKRELSDLLQSAGFHVSWGDAQNPDHSSQVSNLIVLELHDVCALPPGNYRVEPSVDSGAKLGETAVASSGVLPFSRINCANLTRMIAPTLSAEPAAQRDYLYGRAMARVAAHELFHVLGSREHVREGVAKSRFTAADLLDEVFDFDIVAISKMHPKSESGARTSASDAATARDR